MAMNESSFSAALLHFQAEDEQRFKVKINDAGIGLESALARADVKDSSGVTDDLVSTATLTVDSDDTLETLETKKTCSFSSLLPSTVSLNDATTFTEEEKEVLRSIMTPILGCIPFEKMEGKEYIPILEAPGGTDKDPISGHRRDSVPIATSIAEGDKSASGILFFLDETVNRKAKTINAILFRYILRVATGVVVRVNPGTLSTVAQNALDAMLTELSASGICIMTSPHVIRQMGAKDSLVKIRNLRCGLQDTYVYYHAEAFCEGFRRSIAFRPRVIKQNRGSQGEGIWICKLKDETQYCANYGNAIAALDTELILTEANDNHVEHHTVGEFLEFAINGRTDSAGIWKSAGKGCYLDGGVESGAMLVDQRFLPRIVEGEVRCNMIGDKLVNLVHKVPKAGAVSAALQSGAIYTSYKPDDPKFASLVKAFHDDMPNIMAAFGRAGEPLPLLWAADFIFDYDEDGNDVFYVGEFNCSCVGITKDLHLAELVAKTIIANCIER